MKRSGSILAAGVLAACCAALPPSALGAGDAKPAGAHAKPGNDKGKKKAKKKDKRKDKGENKDHKEKTDGHRVAEPEPAAGDSVLDALQRQPAAAGAGWCAWLSAKPGTLYDNKSNPWVQLVRFRGRYHYQAAYLDGRDMNGRDFNDKYNENRRFRLETRLKFLGFLSADVDLNMVKDDRFKSPPNGGIDWGYRDFDTATLACDLKSAFGLSSVDGLSVTYGKMKMPVTEEQRQGSDDILTVERSLLSDRLAGRESRPTGVMVEAGKGAWLGKVGLFSGEDDADFIGGWNDGTTWFYSLTWQPRDDLEVTLDYTRTDRSGTDDALGYREAVALGATYDHKPWGVLATLAAGDNGYGDPADSARNRVRRDGDFRGVVVMPWYWLVENKLQFVCRFEHDSSEREEGLQLSSRYIRANHDDPLVNVNNGRGNRYNAWYLGLNYYPCGDNLKILGGVMFENMRVSDEVKIDRPRKQGGDYYVTQRGTLKAVTYMIAVRTSF